MTDDAGTEIAMGDVGEVVVTEIGSRPGHGGQVQARGIFDEQEEKENVGGVAAKEIADWGDAGDRPPYDGAEIEHCEVANRIEGEANEVSVVPLGPFPHPDEHSTPVDDADAPAP